MSKLKKYPDGRKEIICRYCGKLFLGNYNKKVCFDCRIKKNRIRAKERAKKIREKLNNK
ncbi:MAG: hypothetical protein ACP6IY_19535 [Promethearchaeia archaeon]